MPGRVFTASQYTDTKPALFVCRDDAEYARVRRLMLSATIGGDVANTPVDFARSDLFVLFPGQRPTAGYSVRFLPNMQKRDDGKLLELVVKMTAPVSGTIQAQVMTSPAAEMAIAKEFLAQVKKIRVLSDDGHVVLEIDRH